MNCDTASGQKSIGDTVRSTGSTSESRRSEKEGKISENFLFSHQNTWQCREKNIHFYYAADAGNLFSVSAASSNTKEYSLGNFISRKTLFGIEKAA